MKTKLCRPVLIRTNEESHLQITNGKLYYSDKLFCANHPDMPEVGFINPNQNQQLILISLDPNDRVEKDEIVYIELGENSRLTKIVNLKSQHSIFNVEIEEGYVKLESLKKVVVTQSQLSPEYIQRFVEEYNKKEVKDVEIEMNVVTMSQSSKRYEDNDIFVNGEFVESIDHTLTEIIDKTIQRYNFPKLPNGFVTIVEKEQLDNHSFELGYKSCEKHYKDLKSKMYTEEEVKQRCLWAMEFAQERREYAFELIDNWFEQNKKK